jgi:hypothetical protein
MRFFLESSSMTNETFIEGSPLSLGLSKNAIIPNREYPAISKTKGSW